MYHNIAAHVLLFVNLHTSSEYAIKLAKHIAILMY